MVARPRNEDINEKQLAKVRRTVVRVLGQTHRSDQAPQIQWPIHKPGRANRRQLRSAAAALKGISTRELTNDTVDEMVNKIVDSATNMADRVGEHLNSVARHLASIGCATESEIAAYFEVERRVLTDLYCEARKPCPSPTTMRKLALRYALDARDEVEGDLRRFDLKRRASGWEIIDYCSPALKFAGIEKPGQTVTNVFAVSILDMIHAEKPPFYRLAALLEELVGAVPDDNKSPACQVTEREPDTRIEVDLDAKVVLLDGEPIGVKEKEAFFIAAVVAAKGSWISSSEMTKSDEYGLILGSRPDRIYKKLPQQIKTRIESQGGKGYRVLAA